MSKAPANIRSLARSHTETALNVLVGIMNSAEAPDAARVSAANSILDRGWGKPAQPIVGDDEAAPISSKLTWEIIRPNAGPPVQGG